MVEVVVVVESQIIDIDSISATILDRTQIHLLRQLFQS